VTPYPVLKLPVLGFMWYFDEKFLKGEPCVVLCGIINKDAKTVKNNGKEPFQKALRSFS